MPQQFRDGDEAMAALQELDLNHLTATLEWIYRFLEMEFESTMPAGKGANSLQWQEVKERFTSHGFTANANTDDQFIEADPLNHAGYIIGQFMAILSGGPLYKLHAAQFLMRLCSEWLAQFVKVPTP